MFTFGGSASYIGTDVDHTIISSLLNNGASTLDRTTLRGNTATARGGGLYVETGSTANITSNTINNNHATHPTNNTFGGGVYSRGTLITEATTISGNTASHAGGIFNRDDPATLTTSTVSGNQATIAVGGVWNHTGTTTLERSTLSGNQAPSSAGIHNQGDLVLRNSTISGNEAVDFTGGIRSNGGTVSIEHSTITNNRADSDGNNTGAYGGVLADFGAVITVTHSIIAENYLGAGTTTHDDVNAGGGSFVSANYNLIGNADPVAAAFNLSGDRSAWIAFLTQ